MPQPPQLVTLFMVSTHVLLQLTVPAPQQRPLEQLFGDAQGMPQPPQLFALLFGFTHDEPQHS